MTLEGRLHLTRRGFLAVSSAAAVAAAGIGSASPAEAASSFAISTGKVDITPPVGYPMAGYGYSREATDVKARLYARCTVLWDAGSPNVIVTADVLGFARGLHQQIRAEVQKLGVASSDFVLTATHTHNGPVLAEKPDPYMAYGITDTTRIQAYSSDLITAIVSLIDETLHAPRTDCTLDYKVLSAGFSFNRAGLAYVEHDVPTLVARDLQGKPRAVLFGYGAHPVAGGPQLSFDPDYPGQAIKTIEATGPGVFAQFILGPAGDQDPPREPRDFTTSDKYGAEIGASIADALRTPGRAISGPITTAYTELSLPLDITDTPSNLAAVRNIYVQRRTADLPAFKQRHAEIMVKQIDAHSFATSVPLPLQTWKFAGAPGLSIVFSGGEVVSGYAVYFRNSNGGSNALWFNAYANEVPCYIPSDELLRRTTGWTYEAGFDPNDPRYPAYPYLGVAGESMCFYGHMGHFKGRPAGTTVTGVEQIFIAGIKTIL